MIDMPHIEDPDGTCSDRCVATHPEHAETRGGDDDYDLVPARDLRAGDIVDLERAYRTWPEGDEAQELADNVHWTLYEHACLERDPTPKTARPDGTVTVVTIEHDYGFFDLPADFTVPRLRREHP